MIETCNYDFLCKKCVFFTNNKKDFDRHIKTTKHEKQQELTYNCDICNKTYKTRSGLWKHKKATHNDIIVKNDINIKDNKEYHTKNKIDKLEKMVINIFLKNLHNLKPTERPIHCSDKKRMRFYIKDEDEWKKPTDSNDRLDKTISQVSHKQIKEIKEWEQMYPHWNKSDKEKEMYLKMIQQVMGGKNDIEIQKNKNDIKKELGNKIDLKMAIENT